MFRKFCILALACSAFRCLAQLSGSSTDRAVASCLFGSCITGENPAAAACLPSAPVRGKWEVEDFKRSDASVSCAAVQYDSTVACPVLHLICPRPDVCSVARIFDPHLEAGQ